MLVECPLETESSLVVPYLYFCIVRTGDYVRLGRVDDDASDEIVMSLKGLHLLHRIVVEHSHLEIIAAGQHPVLATYKFDSTDGEGRSFDCAYAGLCDARDTLLA